MNKVKCTCKNCRKRIDYVIVHRFNRDGSDNESRETILGGDIVDGSRTAYYLDIDKGASMFEFDNCYEEFTNHIWCPLCGKYPFAGSVSIYERSHVVFGISRKRDFEI